MYVFIALFNSLSGYRQRGLRSVPRKSALITTAPGCDHTCAIRISTGCVNFMCLLCVCLYDCCFCLRYRLYLFMLYVWCVLCRWCLSLFAYADLHGVHRDVLDVDGLVVHGLSGGSQWYRRPWKEIVIPFTWVALLVYATCLMQASFVWYVLRRVKDHHNLPRLKKTCVRWVVLSGSPWFYASLGHATQWAKLFSTPWFCAWQADIPKGLLLRRKCCFLPYRLPPGCCFSLRLAAKEAKATFPRACPPLLLRGHNFTQPPCRKPQLQTFLDSNWQHLVSGGAQNLVAQILVMKMFHE